MGDQNPRAPQAGVVPNLVQAEVVQQEQPPQPEIQQDDQQAAPNAPPVAEAAEEDHDLEEVKRRIKLLEDSQKPSVESSLNHVRMLLKAPIFSKDQALDYLLSLSMVAKESKHPKAGFYQAVLRALRDKANSSEALFRKYLEVLLGDKDEEKVLEMMAKVDKSTRHSLASNTSRGPRASGRGFGRFSNVECFHCNQLGHYRSHCPMRKYRPRRGGSTQSGTST